MLADSTNINARAGRLAEDIHLPSTAKLQIVDFIAEKLPAWRDDPERPPSTAETFLTEHLCDFLNYAAYYSPSWSHIQFRTETGDETYGNRKIDLTVKPRVAALVIENRRHNLYESLFPIECKRLPTPQSAGRDEREYVITKEKTTGGIQRFKYGHHGSSHNFAAMIGYVQGQTCSHWLKEVNCWISALALDSNSVWSDADLLHLITEDLARKVITLKSEHTRDGELNKCELRHLWIEMKDI